VVSAGILDLLTLNEDDPYLGVGTLFAGDDGQEFDAEIAPFSLNVPYAMN